MTIPTTQAIIGGPSVPAYYLYKWLNARASHIPFTAQYQIADAYTVYGHLTGIGNILPFAQALHETGHFSSPRWRQSNNPAGLGATDDGAWGGNFATPEAGIFAQYCHLLCYATTPGNTLYDGLARLSPRHDAMYLVYGRGSAPRWRDLHRKWNSPKAPNTEEANYGLRVLTIADAVLRA